MGQAFAIDYQGAIPLSPSGGTTGVQQTGMFSALIIHPVMLLVQHPLIVT